MSWFWSPGRMFDTPGFKMCNIESDQSNSGAFVIHDEPVMALVLHLRGLNQVTGTSLNLRFVDVEAA